MLGKTCVIIPAFQAARTIGAVVADLRQTFADVAIPIMVVDDGSSDETAARAEEAGAEVLVHASNRGKGAALRLGMNHAVRAGFQAAITVDADGQHPASSARKLLEASSDPRDLVLGVRDLVRAGAPSANQLSNRISNFFLSQFTGEELRDTQCGLRRYPLPSVPELGGISVGYAYEAEIILRALAAGIRVVQCPIDVKYPADRVTFFHNVRDPQRIIATVLATLFELKLRKKQWSGSPESSAPKAVQPMPEAFRD